MEIIQWSENYSVGNQEIDQQHKQLFLTFAKLVQGIEKGASSFQLEQSFVQLCGYVKNHFRFEEKLMKKAGYPELAAHKKKHVKIKEKLKDFRGDFNKATGKKKDAVATEVAAFLQEWLQGHIKGDDQQYVPYISKPEEVLQSAVSQKPVSKDSNLAPFVWSDVYSVGNQSIDEQHQRLFAIFNGLVTAINTGESEFGVEKTFMQLRGYVRNHFRYEESLMKKKRFPGYKAHKETHDLICLTLKNYRRRFNADGGDKEQIALEVAGFFKTWLKGHIKTEDQQYSLYIAD